MKCTDTVPKSLGTDCSPPPTRPAEAPTPAAYPPVASTTGLYATLFALPFLLDTSSSALITAPLSSLTSRLGVAAEADDFGEVEVEGVLHHQRMASQEGLVSTRMSSSREFAGLGGKGVLANHVWMGMQK